MAVLTVGLSAPSDPVLPLSKAACADKLAARVVSISNDKVPRRGARSSIWVGMFISTPRWFKTIPY